MGCEAEKTLVGRALRDPVLLTFMHLQAMNDVQQAEAHLSEAKSLAVHISQLPDSLQNVRLQGLAAYLNLQLH